MDRIHCYIEKGKPYATCDLVSPGSSRPNTMGRISETVGHWGSSAWESRASLAHLRRDRHMKRLLAQQYL
jgi:hypothetical protein